MCDTFVALGNSTSNGSVLFAKNSDREPSEPHIIVRIPHKKHILGEKVKCTYIEIDQTSETNDVFLFKPSWIWGAEMGVNEYGVVIGNEAVFTKHRQGPEALLGMDILRLALERCKNAAEAAAYIAYLVEAYGQGGKCGYSQDLRYDNSFLVADRKCAYVVETSGKFWIIDRVEDVRSISNSLSIETKYHMRHQGIVKNALIRTYFSGNDQFNFKKCYENKLYSYVSCGDIRRQVSESALRKKIGKLDVLDMINILRQHDNECIGKEFEKSSMKSICMHAGGVVSSQTTGSFVVELKEDDINIWATGSPLPCIAIYKPIWFTNYQVPLFMEENKENKEVYWEKRNILVKMFIENRINNAYEYLSKRNKLEDEFFTVAQKVEGEKEKIELMEKAYLLDEELTDKTLGEYKKGIPLINGNLYYRYYWKKQISNMNLK